MQKASKKRKPKRKDSVVFLRITREDKELLKEAAAYEEMDLSDWLRRVAKAVATKVIARKKGK